MVDPLTQRHRAQQLLLRKTTALGVAKAWSALDWNRLDATYPTLALLLARLVEANRRTSAGLAAGYLREFRKDRQVVGTAKIALAKPLIVDQFNASLSTTSIAALKSSAAIGTAPDVAMRNSLTQAQGAMSRLVLNAGRDTVADSIAADSAGVGYQRVLGGGGCDFCQMLASRGGVYSAAGGDFDAHDHCGCTAEPVYEGMEPRAVYSPKEPAARTKMPTSAPTPEVPPGFDPEEVLSGMERMARKLTPTELRMETRRGSATAKAMARKELARRGLRV